MERKEAIEVVKNHLPHSSFKALREALEILIPELAESEDEMARKEILDYCHKRMNNEFSPITINQVERWLAWLEKQDCWTIEDAKDGDVLVSFYGKPFIYNGRFIASSVGAYCGLNICDIFVKEEITKASNWTRKDGIKPATKEQCDFLFQKMREEGYEWDAEKKELKEIAQEPAWSDADEERFVSCLQRLGTGNIEQPDTINTMWLKSLKNRVQSIAKFVGEGQYNKGFGDGVSKVLQNPEEYGLTPPF